jgi:hypothetical protein
MSEADEGAKLKAYQAQIGFYDTVVAAPSQAAALRVWGVRQNLFAGDEARASHALLPPALRQSRHQ